MTLYASDTIVWLPTYVAVGVVALSLIDKLNRLVAPMIGPFGRVPVIIAIMTELAVCASMLTGVASGAVILSLGGYVLVSSATLFESRYLDDGSGGKAVVASHKNVRTDMSIIATLATLITVSFVLKTLIPA
jgi:hypothetical protein